jgi:hypothetical protein
MKKNQGKETAAAGEGSGSHGNNDVGTTGTNVNRRLFTVNDIIPSSPPSGPSGNAGSAGPASGPCSGTYTPAPGDQGAGLDVEMTDQDVASPQTAALPDQNLETTVGIDARDFLVDHIPADDEARYVRYSGLAQSAA